ncbi:MAG: hypothetical protein WCB12_21920 [Bryobacteraceae bacterium]
MRTEPGEGATIGFFDVGSDLFRCGQIAALLIIGEDTIPFVLARQHLDLWWHFLRLAPLKCEPQHAAQHLQHTIDAADLQLVGPEGLDEVRDRTSRDRVQFALRQRRECSQAFEAGLVVFERLWLVGESGLDERKKVLIGEFRKRWDDLALSNSYFTLRERNFMRSLHLLRDAFIGLLCALAHLLAIPFEFVPPIL